MTQNQFKLVCLMFTKAFEGKKYGEVIKDCYSMNEECIISSKEIKFGVNIEDFGYVNYESLFNYFNKKLIIYKTSISNDRFKTVEDFLNYFKIYFEDIV